MDLEDRGFEETVREKSRTDLYNYIKQSSGRLLDDKFAYMEDCVIRETNCPTEKISSLKKELKLFKWQFRQKWTAASYKEERFLQNNAKWLTGTIKLSAWVKQKTGRPRPSKEFGELSDRSKRRKTKELRAQVINTNTGNVSRRFFCDPETASRITGVDLDLIKRLRTLLEVISSGHRIDTDKLSTFCKETSEIYVRLYGWYPMTPTLHKLLVHGPTIIKHAIIPIGQLSEEAAEARNKHFRQYRTDFARKFSKISCNVDVLNRLLLSSDPLLSCTRSRFMKNKKPFTKEALEFLIPESDDSEDTGAQYTTTIDECDISDDNEFD
ncbi:hypothetical protein ACJJTC_003755 [Scirpophaga incertulas]